MKLLVSLVPLALLAPLALVPAGGGVGDLVTDRQYVLVMHGNSFNGATGPSTPLVEAFVGDTVRFVVTVPAGLEPHTFHLHGHPWLLAEGRYTDTILLEPGEVDTFVITAGGPDARVGDWMYHCHIGDHQARGMWGIFRVYNFSVQAQQSSSGLVVELDRLGTAIRGASLEVTLDGVALPVHVEEAGEGVYRVHGVPAGAPVVVTATHPDYGESVARLNGAPVPTMAGGPLHAGGH